MSTFGEAVARFRTDEPIEERVESFASTIRMIFVRRPIVKCITTKQACVFIALVAPGLIPESAHAGRQYNPTQRRFQQRDPAGTRTGLNAFVYGDSNPLVALDPSGAVISNFQYTPGTAIDITMNIAFWGNYISQGRPGNVPFFAKTMFALQELYTSWNEPWSNGVGVCNRPTRSPCVPVRFTFNSNIQAIQFPGGSSCNSVVAPPFPPYSCWDLSRQLTGLQNANSIFIQSPPCQGSNFNCGVTNPATHSEVSINWDTITNPNPYSRTLSHEIGHCMGLLHPTYPANYPPERMHGMMSVPFGGLDKIVRRVADYELEKLVNENIQGGGWVACHQLYGPCPRRGGRRMPIEGPQYPY